MNKVVPFAGVYRKNFIFRNKPVQVIGAEGQSMSFPCIGLYEKETNIPICYPTLERWLFNLAEAESKANSTLQKKSYTLCNFLNFILWNTDCNTIHEITIPVIRDFMVDYKTTISGKQRDPVEWHRGINDVYTFLECYQKYNHDEFAFSYNISEISKTEIVRMKEGFGMVKFKNNYKFGVKEPKKTYKKNRVLMHGYLDLLLLEAKKHDPMLTLAIALQAYAGLREGEVVNLTRGSIKLIYGGFGRIGKVRIDMTEDATFKTAWAGKSDFGSIKVYRMQDVYNDFLSNVIDLYEEHERLLNIMNAPEAEEAPLFINNWKKPMTVHTYRGRLKKLFFNYFLPSLEKSCEIQNEWAVNAPYIEIYKKEYPGAHSLRHWFTMYLVTKAKLSVDEVSKWRGDRSRDSMLDYVHVNRDMIEAYRESSYALQELVLEEVLWQK